MYGWINSSACRNILREQWFGWGAVIWGKDSIDRRNQKLLTKWALQQQPSQKHFGQCLLIYSSRISAHIENRRCISRTVLRERSCLSFFHKTRYHKTKQTNKRNRIHFLNNNMKSSTAFWVYVKNDKIISFRPTGQSSHKFGSCINITLTATKTIKWNSL